MKKSRQDDLIFLPPLANVRVDKAPSESEEIFEDDGLFTDADNSPLSCPSCDKVSCGRLCPECGAVIWTSGHLQHLEKYQIE